MKNKSNSDIQLPPGFRFHPSDEELIVHYLRNKATASSLPASIIAEVDLYKCNPWELPGKALFGEEEWYFFTPRDRKYPNGARPNRMAASGYWKPTGTDKPVLSSHGRKILGVKKTLVFYKGRPPRGVETNWIMHEYRLPEGTMVTATQKGSMRLDDWVLCRVRQKINMSGNSGVEDGCGSNNEPPGYSQKGEKTSSTTPNKAEMVKDILYRDSLVLPLIFASEDLPFLDTVSSISFEDSRPYTNSVSQDHSNTNHSQYSDSLIGGKRRKPHEGNQSFIQSKKKLTDKQHRLSDNNTELNFCSTDQSEGDNFNPHSMEFYDPISRFNHLAFLED